jgi:hypothetical protein
MDTNDEIRRKRLQYLCSQAGGLRAVAEASQTHWQYLDQVLKRRLLKPRKDGTQVAAAIGDDLARRIEASHNLGAGWLDWPFEAVPFAAWQQLGESDRGYVQAAMRQAIKERLGDVPTETVSIPAAFVPHPRQKDEPSSVVMPNARSVTQSNTKQHGQPLTVGPALQDSLVPGKEPKNERQRKGRQPAKAQKPGTGRRV